MSNRLVEEFNEARENLEAARKELHELAKREKDEESQFRLEELAGTIIFLRSWMKSILSDAYRKVPIGKKSHPDKKLFAAALLEPWLWRGNCLDLRMDVPESELRELEDAGAQGTREYHYILDQYMTRLDAAETLELKRRRAFRLGDVAWLRQYQPPQLQDPGADEAAEPVCRNFKLYRGGSDTTPVPDLSSLAADMDLPEKETSLQSKEAQLLLTINKHPGDPYGYKELGNFYHEIEQVEKACRYWRRAIDLGLDDIEVLFGLLYSVRDQDPAVFKKYIFSAYGMTVARISDWRKLAGLFQSMGEEEHVKLCQAKIEKIKKERDNPENVIKIR